MTDLEKLKRFDEEMRKRFGVKWAPPVPVPPEEQDPAAARKPEETGPIITKPNKAENEFILNTMILRNTMTVFGPEMRDRARRAGKTIWRDIRLITILVNRVQDALVKTVPERRREYYNAYSYFGHYECMINGPVRNHRQVLIGDKYLGALCDAAMKSTCCMCMREGDEIGTCLIRQALMDVAPPTAVEDGRWRKCEYRETAFKILMGQEVEV